MIIVVAVGIFICSIGVQSGLEKVSKFMMVALLIIMIGSCRKQLFYERGKGGP